MYSDKSYAQAVGKDINSGSGQANKRDVIEFWVKEEKKE